MPVEFLFTSTVPDYTFVGYRVTCGTAEAQRVWKVVMALTRITIRMDPATGEPIVVSDAHALRIAEVLRAAGYIVEMREA